MLDSTNADIVWTHSSASDPIPSKLTALEQPHIASSTGQPVIDTITRETQQGQLFPFRVKHLGKSEVYVLFASSEKERKEWCENIIWAKAAYATFLHSQNAEVFSVSLVAHSTSRTEGFVQPNKYFKIQGTSLSRAAGQSESALKISGKATCATSLELDGTRWTIVGTNVAFHVFTAEHPPRFFFSTSLPHVEQLCAIPKFNLLVVLASNVLYTYELDSLLNYFLSENRKASSPGTQKYREGVDSFVAGNVLGKTQLFCLQKEPSQTGVWVCHAMPFHLTRIG